MNDAAKWAVFDLLKALDVIHDHQHHEVFQRVADGLGNGIDAPLLCGLVGVIEIEFVAKFVERHNMDYLVMALDQKDAAKTLTAYGVNAIPEVVLIDRQGIVRQVIVGGGTEKIDEEVAKLLAERP